MKLAIVLECAMNNTLTPKNNVESVAQIIQDLYFERGARIDQKSWTDTVGLLTGLLLTQSKAQEEAYAEGMITERKRWVQKLPNETISITIEGRVDGKLVANRKFVSAKDAFMSNWLSLFKTGEIAIAEIIEALTHPTIKSNPSE